MIGWADWRAQAPAPPFAPLAGLLPYLPRERWPTVEDWNALAARHQLRNARGLTLRFADDDGARVSALEFERRILEDAEVPTRAQSWHDAFHACAWLLFPFTKACINVLHVRAGGSTTANGRSPLRDLLTLFDESGIVIACADGDLAQLLADFRWQELFWARRADAAREMDFVIFGHALYEHCHQLRDGVTGKAIVIPVDAEYFSWNATRRIAHLDHRLAALFGADHAWRGPRDLHPLPIKGIPGWAPENENPAYYLDERQFRPGRTRRAHDGGGDTPHSGAQPASNK